MSKSKFVRNSAALCVLVLLCANVPLQAADSPDGDAGRRLRVGLVLGGGGARGAAHIGVLRELERLHVPVDAIAGTSMGAIVGGLYASGMSASELEQVVLSLEWAKILSDTPIREDLSFRRKQDDIQYPVELEFGIKGGSLVLPSGLVQGQNLGLVLRELTAKVAHIGNYDELPIPFRAVASNIETGEAHVMASGDLARSIRASMSVPGLIAPARVDGQLLVDGGIVANLPVDVIRSMNVDVIIAVDVEFPLYAPEELQSALQISEQMLTILTRKETLRQISTLQTQDILIRPGLGTFSSTDFDEAGEAIAAGVAAANDVEDRLRQLSLDEEAYAAYVNGKTAQSASGTTLAFVRIIHDDRMSAALIASRLGVFVGDTVEPEHLAEGANRLYDLDLYQQVSYRLVQEDGETGVIYTAVAKSWGPDFLNVGFSVQDDFEGTTTLNMFGRITRTGLNSRAAEWRTDFQLGTDLGVWSEYHQPFGKKLRYFFEPRFELRQDNHYVYLDDDPFAELRTTSSRFGLDLGTELGNAGEMRIGVYRGSGANRVLLGDAAASNIDFDSGGLFAKLQFDTQDDSRFPRRGYRANLGWDASRRSFGASEDYESFSADFDSAWSHGKNTVRLGLSYATSFGADDQLQAYYPMGGFLRLSGLAQGQISGPHTALGRLVYYRLISDYTGGLFEVPIYIGASVETGNAWMSRAEMGIDSALTNGSVFAAFDTYLGAIYIAAGFAEGGKQTWYLSIGSPPR